MNKHINIKVTGRVQGVFFRAFTRDLAQKLGITGFVRNEDDSSVYIEVEGKEELLQNFINEIKKGPPHAEVKNVQLSDDGELKLFIDFKITHNS